MKYFGFFMICIITFSSFYTADASSKKLYWYIPDGMRSEPELFNIYKWAEEGKLPNIKKMMDNGSYGFCVPVFPSHTPANYASLFTGAYPKTHGVPDGPMHTEGYKLDRPSVGGFRSAAKRVPSIWTNLEKSGKDVALLALPGSTPPELDGGYTIRGRWGGWGADFHALIFQSKEDMKMRKKQGRSSRLFYFGPQLANYISSPKATGWKNPPRSYSSPKEAHADGWGRRIYFYIYDSTDDRKINYDRIAFSFDKKNIEADITQGQWSNWYETKLKWKKVDVDSHVMFHIIKLSPNGFFRVRVIYDNLNEYITKPSYASEQITKAAGPMLDFVDNFPPQLIYYKEDKRTFLDEMDLALNWHKRAADFMLRNYSPDVFIESSYSPNQMLTSRWWMGYIDPKSARYNEVSSVKRQKLMNEVLGMYKKLDDHLGVLLKNADKNTYVVLSSDHGAVPYDRRVKLNNLFYKHGLLKFKINTTTGEPEIDWANTKAIFLKMASIYISPTGLAGKWKRASGLEYEKLRIKVKNILMDLTDENGKKPVNHVIRWEEVEDYLQLPPDRVGDLVIGANAGYFWEEEMTDTLEVFDTPLKTGYKQTLSAKMTPGMWTPFMIMGPGVKKGYQIDEPINMVDQYPTIMTLMDEKLPEYVEGKTLKQIFK